MQIKNLDKELMDLNGKPIGEALISLDEIIHQVRINKDTSSLVKQLENVKESTVRLTYGKVYEDAVFFDVEKAEPQEFVAALELAEKLRKKDQDFTIDELKIIQDRLARTKYSVIVKGLAIRNLQEK